MRGEALAGADVALERDLERGAAVAAAIAGEDRARAKQNVVRDAVADAFEDPRDRRIAALRDREAQPFLTVRLRRGCRRSRGPRFGAGELRRTGRPRRLGRRLGRRRRRCFGGGRARIGDALLLGRLRLFALRAPLLGLAFVGGAAFLGAPSFFGGPALLRGPQRRESLFLGGPQRLGDPPPFRDAPLRVGLAFGLLALDPAAATALVRGGQPVLRVGGRGRGDPLPGGA
jgi:hypothetical protein